MSRGREQRRPEAGLARAKRVGQTEHPAHVVHVSNDIHRSDRRGRGPARDDGFREGEADPPAVRRQARDREERAERLAGRFHEVAGSEPVVPRPALRPAVPEVDADAEPEPQALHEVVAGDPLGRPAEHGERRLAAAARGSPPAVPRAGCSEAPTARAPPVVPSARTGAGLVPPLWRRPRDPSRGRQPACRHGPP